MKVVRDCLTLFDRELHLLKLFRDSVHTFFGTHPALNDPADPVIHTIKSRVKDRQHLRKKLLRKLAEGDDITADNFFDCITDLAGVRVLHLHQRQFPAIADAINEHIQKGEWVLYEK